MRKILSLSFIVMIAVLFSHCGGADTKEARLTAAREILKTQCNSLSDIILTTLKKETKIGATDSSGTWAKITDATVSWGLKTLIAKECDCVTDPIADQLAEHYTLGELEGFKTKSLADISFLPEATLKCADKLRACVPGL